MEVVPKGWGHERVYWNGVYCMKVLSFDKDKKCSYHWHPIKDEIFFIHTGFFRVLFSPPTHPSPDDSEQAKILFLRPGDVLRIPPGTRHQMTAIEAGEILESSSYHDDSDVVRVIRGD